MEPAPSSQWLRGKVKAVLSGDTVLVMAFSNSGIPPEKTLSLAHLSAPELAHICGQDEPFAWDSREHLRNLCIGKEVVFRAEYIIPGDILEFCSIYLGATNVGNEVVTRGWAKVNEAKGKVTPPDLLYLEEQARQQGVGLWNTSLASAIRKLPPSAVGDPCRTMGLLALNKGKPIKAIVEKVCDGSSVRAYLIPEFQYVQVCLAGIQAPSMGRIPQEFSTSTEVPIDEPSPDAFGREAKHFTELCVLHRDVNIVLEGLDNYSNFIGSVCYADGESAKNLAIELTENGYAKYAEWSASLIEEETRRRLKAAELQAKNTKLRLWMNYRPPTTNFEALIDDNFTGQVVEIVSGDCIIVADNSLPCGSPAAERRVNLSSIRCPTLGNPLRREKPAPYARVARDLLRTRLIGRQVEVVMEYSQKAPLADSTATPAGPADSRVMRFGSVYLLSEGKGSKDDESRASRRKGIHPAGDPPSDGVTDFMTDSSKKYIGYLSTLHNKRLTAVVEHIYSGHRFRLSIPKEKCSFEFSLSGVRCPARADRYSDEAVSLMRRMIMRKDVEIEVDKVDRTGTCLGSLWESKTNVGITLLKAGLAKLQKFGADGVRDAHLLAQAERSAKKHKLMIWEEHMDLTPVKKKQKDKLKVVVTEVLDGGKFYVHAVADLSYASVQQQLDSLRLSETSVMESFNPKKGDLVLAQYKNSWKRAITCKVHATHGVEQTTGDFFQVFYLDQGNQEVVTYSQLRPFDPRVSFAPGLALLCKLAYIEVPTSDEDYGREAVEHLRELTLYRSRELKAVIEERDTSGGKIEGQGKGNPLLVTLIDEKLNTSINGLMLKAGAARLEKRRQELKERHVVLDELEKYEAEARTSRLGIWEWACVSSTAPLNVAELIIAHGYGTVVRHSDFEERSNHYEDLLAAESSARFGKKGIHSAKDPPSMHVTDILMVSAKRAIEFFPVLQRNTRVAAVVEYVFSGHKFKLFIPKERSNIGFSLSGVRSPEKMYSDEAISFMRQKIMHRDVEISVEDVDRTGTFQGTLWESKTNVKIILLESGLARLETGIDKIPDGHLLVKAERSAKRQKLKIWENRVEEEEVTNSATPIKKQIKDIKVVVTEVLGGGKFYVQAVADPKVASIKRQLASLSLKDAAVSGAFNPKNGDLVLAQYGGDKSWNRAMVVNGPSGVARVNKAIYEVFYIDYGNHEAVTYSSLRPMDPSVSSVHGLAQLCQLAYIKVPTLDEKYGQQAAVLLSQHTLVEGKEFKAVIEQGNISAGEVKGEGTETMLSVTLLDEEANTSINAMMLKAGLARLDVRRRWEPRRQGVLDDLEKYESEARTNRYGIWNLRWSRSSYQ